MTRALILRYSLILFGALACVQSASAQPGYFQEVPVPTDPAPLEVARGDYFDGRQVVVRFGQQGIRFTFTGNTVVQLRVRTRPVGTPGWSVWSDLHTSGNGGISSYTWASLPFAGPGAYDMELAVYGVDETRVHTFQAVVVPPAQRAFASSEPTTFDPRTGEPGTLRHTMLVWSGPVGSTALDKPLLVVEGIDASNENSPGAYYALGFRRGLNDLFPRGQAKGADIVILDFGDGGRRMQANAAVVRQAITVLKSYSTDPSRSLDVIGVSMGGVVARYALAQMEQERSLSGVGTFMSVDAPQQGAVIQRDLQDRIRQYLDPVDWPPGLARPAGRQLLQYNAFDSAVPTDHQQFYAELQALNGGLGYPTLTQNVGVSFGTPQANPNAGERWGRLDLDHLLSPVFTGGWDFNAANGAGGPGSYLPRDATQVMGSLLIGVPRTNLPEVYPVSYEFGRYEPVHPTFIPYVSALDITNGVSKFDGALIALPAGVEPSFHDIVPEALVGPMLNRLGYELPPPPSVAISGPSTLATGQTGVWQASTPNPGAGYQYNWQYRIFLSSCGGDGPELYAVPGTTPEANSTLPAPDPGNPGLPEPEHLPPCAEWHDGYGSGAEFTYRTATSLRLELRVTATGGGGSAASSVHSVCIGACGGGLEALASGDPSAEMSAKNANAARSVATVLDAGAPAGPLLEGVWPNPFGSGAGTRSQTTIRFALSEGGPVRLYVFDALGREVARLVNDVVESGSHMATFDASALPAGAYVVRLEATGTVRTRLITHAR